MERLNEEEMGEGATKMGIDENTQLRRGEKSNPHHFDFPLVCK
jgi:hypothetical protein